MKFLLKTFFTICLIIIFTSTTFAQNIPLQILPQNDGFITDQANLLSPTDKTQVQQVIESLRTNQGVELAVVTINSLQGYPIEDYTLQLGRLWGIGQKDTNSGVLFLIAPNDRQTRIEVGYGIEAELTDAQSHWIIEDIIPYFQNDQYSEGILAGVQKVQQAVQGEYIPLNSTDNNLLIFEKSTIVLFIVLWLLTLISSILARSKSWYAGGIVGAAISTPLSLILGLGLISIITILLSTSLGLAMDKAVSQAYKNKKKTPWWAGGPSSNSFGGRRGGGGFGGGGFGGGSFGGGGSSGRW